MFSFLARFKGTVEFVIFLLICGAMFYGVHSILKYERTMGYTEATAECTTKALMNEIAVRKRYAELSKQVEDAQNAANVLEQENKKLSDALTISDRKLRDTTTTIRNRLSTNTCETNRNTAAAAITVFAECAEEYSQMAKNAAGHAIDVQRLDNGWPKLP